SALANPPIERVSGMGEVVRVVLGPDFHSVGTPAPSGSSVNVQLTHSTSSAPTKLPDDLTVTNAADTTCE
ncbi:MAG TPA: LytR family transcriptional regulator, partial [Mycobacterium sp.]|nr:LytR family transcriptional regulator [Mycobacterium sp.]